MMDIKDIIIIVGCIVSVATFIKAIIEYKKSQFWKKQELLLKEIKEFLNNKDVKIIHEILDYNACTVEIEDKSISLDDDEVMISLLTHDKKSSFTYNQSLLRGLFDDYFDKLTFLISLANNDVIDRKELYGYLKYWLNILGDCGERKPKEWGKTIKEYLDFYDYDVILKSGFIK